MTTAKRLPGSAVFVAAFQSMEAGSAGASCTKFGLQCCMQCSPDRKSEQQQMQQQQSQNGTSCAQTLNTKQALCFEAQNEKSASAAERGPPLSRYGMNDKAEVCIANSVIA